jgi:class 3 adenylate cyclase
MQCPHCQHDNRETAKFCAACGRSFVVTCAACGNQNLPGAAFCDNCGARFAESAPAVPPASPQEREPLSYTPRHLAEKILTSRSALEGERKQVTVLFCDLANSTAIAARIGPDNMHALLNRFFDLALDVVHRLEGTINQFLGDGFMALFGAPIAHEDHARRAVLAALALQRTLHEHHPELGTPHGVVCQFRMGLNSGLVVVGRLSLSETAVRPYGL